MAQVSLSGFADKINEIMPLIIKGFTRRQANELYKGKITLPQFLILNFLTQRRESKMTDLANFMQVSLPAMTGLVDRLVRDNYVIRAYDPQDRRIIRIKITPKATALADKINQQRRAMILKVFGRISAADRQEYLRILMQIKEILSKES